MREFGEVVAPILKDRGLTAVCFLNNHFIDNKNLFFRFKISLLIEKIQTSISDTQLERIGKIISSVPSRSAICKALLALTYHDQEMIAQMAQIVNLDFAKYLAKERPYLSSQEIRELMQQGFEFGAHSLDHPEYYLIDEEEQLRQTDSSLRALNDQFNFLHQTFAFPFTDHQVKLNFFRSLHQAMPEIDLTFGSAGQKKTLLHCTYKESRWKWVLYPVKKSFKPNCYIIFLKDPLVKIRYCDYDRDSGT